MSQQFFNYLRDEYFDSFYDTDDPDYGGFYEEFKNSTHTSEKETIEAIRLLDKGKVKEAEELVEEVLTDVN